MLPVQNHTVRITAFSRAYLPSPATLTDWVDDWRKERPGATWERDEPVEGQVTIHVHGPIALQDVKNTVRPTIRHWNDEHAGVDEIQAFYNE